MECILFGFSFLHEFRRAVNEPLAVRVSHNRPIQKPLLVIFAPRLQRLPTMTHKFDVAWPSFKFQFSVRRDAFQASLASPFFVPECRDNNAIIQRGCAAYMPQHTFNQQLRSPTGANAVSTLQFQFCNFVTFISCFQAAVQRSLTAAIAIIQCNSNGKTF